MAKESIYKKAAVAPIRLNCAAKCGKTLEVPGDTKSVLCDKCYLKGWRLK